MIPLLIISNDSKQIQDYLEKLKADSLFYQVDPSTKEYSINDIKNIFKETKIFYPKTRIYFFPNFQLSSIPAQNSFLKLLEEPPTNVQFILSTGNKNSLLPTIISRVKIIKLRAGKAISQNKFIHDFLTELVEKKTLKILNKPEFSQLKREDSIELFDQFLIFFRGRLEIDNNSPAILKEILRLKSLLENNNLNPQLTIDQLLIFIWKKYTIEIR